LRVLYLSPPPPPPPGSACHLRLVVLSGYSPCGASNTCILSAQDGLLEKGCMSLGNVWPAFSAKSTRWALFCGGVRLCTGATIGYACRNLCSPIPAPEFASAHAYIHYGYLFLQVAGPFSLWHGDGYEKLFQKHGFYVSESFELAVRSSRRLATP